MSDVILAKGSESKFKPHPKGQFVAECVDVINLGQHVHVFAGDDSYLEERCALVYRTGERNSETGDYIDISAEFTISMGAKANLRKFLEQWRGVAYTDEQVLAGVPLDKLTGQFGLLTIDQRTSAKKRVYGNITACVGVPVQMKGMLQHYVDYEREAYWETKKAQYAAEVAAFLGRNLTGNGKITNEELAALVDEEDDLPF